MTFDKGDKELFKLLDLTEQKQVELFLKKTEHETPNWFTPKEGDYSDANFAYQTINRFNGDVEFAIETYNLALQKSREESDKVFNRLKEEKEKGEILTLDDFDGHWGNFKNYLDERYNACLAEQRKVWRDTFQKHFREMKNKYTGEAIRLQ